MPPVVTEASSESTSLSVPALWRTALAFHVSEAFVPPIRVELPVMLVTPLVAVKLPLMVESTRFRVPVPALVRLSAPLPMPVLSVRVVVSEVPAATIGLIPDPARYRMQSKKVK